MESIILTKRFMTLKIGVILKFQKKYKKKIYEIDEKINEVNKQNKRKGTISIVFINKKY